MVPLEFTISIFFKMKMSMLRFSIQAALSKILITTALKKLRIFLGNSGKNSVTSIKKCSERNITVTGLSGVLISRFA